MTKLAAIFLTLMVILTNGQLQAKQKTTPEITKHIQEIIKELPADSSLRRELLNGARGNGIHYPWMDKMRQMGVKHVGIWIHIVFRRNGRPKQLDISRIQFFANYDGGVEVADPKTLDLIRSSGLQEELCEFALQRAAHGTWTDVPRPRPHPFVGGTHIELYDDEWLPTYGPMYYAK